MDDESSKLFKFLSDKEVFKSTDIPTSAKIIKVKALIKKRGFYPSMLDRLSINN